MEAPPWRASSVRTAVGPTPGWSPSISTSTSQRGSTAGSAAAIDDEQPSPYDSFTTTSMPCRSTDSRTSSAAPPSVTTSWSNPHARAQSSTYPSSVPSRYGSSCLGCPSRLDPPAASSNPPVKRLMTDDMAFLPNTRNRRILPPPYRHDLGEYRQRDLLRPACADVESRGRAQAREIGVLQPGRAQLLHHGGAPAPAGNQPHVRDPGAQRALERLLLAATVRGHHHGDVAVLGLDLGAARDGLDVQPDPLADRGQRHGDRSLSEGQHARSGQARLEEDLDRPARQAVVVNRHGPLLRGRLAVAGHDPQEQRLAGLQHARRVQPDRGLRAGAADEALDRAICEDDGAVARADARRPLRAHDDRRDERGPRRDQRVRSARPLGVRHCGGAAFPFIASHTRPGVAGMSMWWTPYGSSASITALITHGGDPTVADSPTPFAPSGWCGDGVTVAPSSRSGTSIADGIR